MDNYSLTEKGKVRKNNQDSFINYFHPRFSVFVVCDGMGGHKAGEVASKMAVESIQKSIINKKDRHDYEDILRESIEEANREVYDESTINDECSNMGTTVVACLVVQDKIYIGHVGDSRAYLIRNSKISRLTKDHSLVQKLLDDGAISLEEARVHPDRSTLTRALGTEVHVEVEMDIIEPEEGDIFLLCSDGLTSMVEDCEIGNIVNEADGAKESVEILVNKALEEGGLDNITISLFVYRSETWNKYC